jgi:hypothetical protein
MAFKKDGFGAAAGLSPRGAKGQPATAFDVFQLGTFC